MYTHLGDGLEVLAADGQVAGALDPLVAVHVDGSAALVLALVVLAEADLAVHVDVVHGSARLHERPAPSDTRR